MTVASNDIEVGYRLPSLIKMVTLETSQLYSGWPKYRHYHTCEEEAQAVGFPTVVLQGLLPVAYISQMCANFFGKCWGNSGKLSVSMIKPIYPPQQLTTRGIVTGKTTKGTAVRVTLDVWVEDSQKRKVTVGTASALV